MHFALQKMGNTDIYSTVFNLRRAVFSARIRKETSPESAGALVNAGDRLVKMVLAKKGKNSLIRMYQMNLALRALVYDLYDMGAIAEEDADEVLEHSFRLERHHLAGVGTCSSCTVSGMDDSPL